MDSNSLFFSLRGKLVILIGSVFLVLQSVFAFIAYQNAQDNFDKNHKKTYANHVSIAQTLSKDSFLVLEQFAELVSQVDDADLNNSKNQDNDKLTLLNEYWARWQLIWDIKNIAFFDNQGLQIKTWGDQSVKADLLVKKVLEQESPEHQIFCPDDCYQQAIIPVMGHSEISGVFSVTRSFADVIIKYRHATDSDVGILISRQESDHQVEANSIHVWKYKLSGMTSPEKNLPVFEFIAKHYVIEDFFKATKRIEYNHAFYEVGVVPIQPAGNGELTPPFFFFISDISQDIAQLNSDLKRIWIYNFFGVIGSLALIILVANLFFNRLARLSEALPLLSQNKFSQFRELISVKNTLNFGHDELDKLSMTAVALANQLEIFELEKRGHTFNLLEKSQDLAKERDFVKQLIELAPIIIIIQKLNGIILAINHTGLESLEVANADVIGKVFDLFLLDTDTDHLKKLNRLRSGEDDGELQLDGTLVTETGKLRDISWIYKLLPSKQFGNEKVILTLGIDISERKLAETRNFRMAYYDYLTGLSNRRKFQEDFNQQLATASRYGYQLALFYLDLDRFKEINDTSGHEAGDNFLKMVANALKDAIRSTDFLCRLGGDEFTLLMPHADLSGVENIAKKINQVLKAQKFSYAGKSFTAGASLGIAIYPLHGQTVNELMANADLAMYRAKELGRGQHHLFNPDYDYRSKLKQTVYWRNVLEDAINNDKFVLFYQPILTIKSNTISHYECLVRLQQDDGQMLMPSEFVTKAEELGLISKIDRMVLKKAIDQHLELNRQGKLHKLSLNISKRTFEEPSIFEYFNELFANPEVDQNRIIFEITDTASTSNEKSDNILINKINKLGCVLALNDFGVESPSLNYLKNSPVDYVKIDGSIIRQLENSNEDKIFVKALIDLAHAYGKKTVAEFVEKESTLTILKEFGIDYAQGFHIGKPEAMD